MSRPDRGEIESPRTAQNGLYGIQGISGCQDQGPGRISRLCGRGGLKWRRPRRVAGPSVRGWVGEDQSSQVHADFPDHLMVLALKSCQRARDRVPAPADYNAWAA